MSDLNPAPRPATPPQGAAPEEILEATFRLWPNTAIFTAFGPEGCALIHMAMQIRPDVKVITIDTGFLFDESIALRRKFVDRYGIQLSVIAGRVSVLAQERLYGPRLHERDPDRCCALRKVEPTNRALAGLDAWITGLRRDQGQSRAGTDVVEVVTRRDGRPLMKVNPLAAWTRADTWNYILGHDVPYNSLLDEGYRSIGCWPCTRAVRDDEDERAGRWEGKKQECGIHTFLERAG